MIPAARRLTRPRGWYRKAVLAGRTSATSGTFAVVELGYARVSTVKQDLTDVPNAELHLLDTGHFALATDAEEIADLIAAFHAKHTAGDPTAAGASS